MTGEVIIVGMGNRFRRDDGVGPLVAEHFIGREPSSVRVILEPADPSVLPGEWQGAALVIVIDAAQSGEPAGTVLRFEPLVSPLPEDVFPAYSTHTIGIGRTIDLGRALHQLPDRLIVYGIEAVDFQSGTGLSADVANAVPRVIREIEAELSLVGDQLEGRLPCMNSL